MIANIDLPAALTALSISLPATAAVVKWKINTSKVDIREFTDFKLEIFKELSEIKTYLKAIHGPIKTE